MKQFFAMTSQGLEGALLLDLEQNQFKGLKKGSMGVFFEGDMSECYRANLVLRTATRVLMPVASFKASTNEELYKNIYDLSFDQYVGVDATLAVHASTRSETFKDQRFVALKTKDAIVDRFREIYGERPNVDKDNPDLIVNVRVIGHDFDVSIDTTGQALSYRGYREKTVMAPLREHLAAGLILYSGWDRRKVLLDPMCGSGTFLIEAAMMAYNIFPALDRKHFSFKKFKNFDAKVFQDMISDLMDREETPSFEEGEMRFYGYDISREAVSHARSNLRAADLSQVISVNALPVVELRPPTNEKGILIVNPPYGERLHRDDDNIKDIYRDLGFTLKNHFKGWELWILSGNKEHVTCMGLKSSLRIPVWNGPIECRFLKYEIK